ncbi:radical SAM protein [Clostridia bacterium]|nr:radical SAM protein [Clostridia bacterium]
MDKLKKIADSFDSIEKQMREICHLRNVLVELTAFCNLNCVQCANDKITRERGYMDWELYTKIADELAEKYPKTNLWYGVYGEPLLVGAEKIREIVRYADERGLTTWMTTNGVLLSDEVCDALIDAGLDNITIAVDGFSAGVYESIRVGAKRDKVYANVLHLRDKVKAKGSKMYIDVQLIEMDENKNEIKDFLKFWADSRIPVRIRGRMTWAGNIELGANIDKQKDRIACGFTFSQLCILWDGKVVSCANDINAMCVLGDASKNTLGNIWEDKLAAFTRIHFEHNFDKLPEHCRNCFDWQVIGTDDYDENGKPFNKEYK